jgi:hypothetical protein
MPMRIPIAADTANLGASQVSLAELESSEYTSCVPLSWRGGATARIIWVCCGSQPAGVSMDLIRLADGSFATVRTVPLF